MRKKTIELGGGKTGGKGSGGRLGASLTATPSEGGVVEAWGFPSWGAEGSEKSAAPGGGLR